MQVNLSSRPPPHLALPNNQSVSSKLHETLSYGIVTPAILMHLQELAWKISE